MYGHFFNKKEQLKGDYIFISIIIYLSNHADFFQRPERCPYCQTSISRSYYTKAFNINSSDSVNIFDTIASTLMLFKMYQID